MFMNEKKHMSKKKKLTIVISAVIALGLVCAGGTWWYKCRHQISYLN